MVSKKKAEKLKKLPLSLVERCVYFIITVATVAYICYCVYADSIKYDGILNLYDFGIGWLSLSREQDTSNFEWHFWYSMFWRISPWYLGHFAVGKIMEWNYMKYRKHGFLVFSVLSLCKLVGWRPVCLYLCHTAILYVTSLVSCSVLVWVVSLGLLSTLNFEPFITMMKSLVDDDEEETWYYLLMFTVALTNIRGTSFCLEKCWNSKTKETKTDKPNPDKMYQELSSKGEEVGENVDTTDDDDDVRQVGDGLLDMLCYVLYLPLFFTGPILTFDLFQSQINAPIPASTRSRVISHVLQLARFIFWAFFNEFILHFFYFNSLQQNMDVLKSVSLFTLAGLGYCHGQFFMLKYLVMFGFPGSVARLDNLDPPAGPKCISYIYLYSDMWKYFDRGLYSFLKRYIYVPCGGSQAGFHKQITASLLCFMYIFYWHGAEYYILLWILLNYLGVSLEKVGSVISGATFVKHVEGHYLSEAMVQRVHAFFFIPIFLISCFSMFCFFGGHIVGYIFFQRLILEGWPSSWATLAFLIYCAIQNGMEVNRWMDNKKKIKQN